MLRKSNMQQHAGDGADSHAPLLVPSASSSRLEAGVADSYGTIRSQSGLPFAADPVSLAAAAAAGDDSDLGRAHHHDADTQAGVQQADAINLVWSRTTLIVAYSFIFLCSFASALQWQIISNLTPYVTSEFSSHSLIPTISIVASVLSGVLKLPIAKIIDLWGRPQGLFVVVVLATIGLVLMASCSNIRTYAAAQVFYQVGLSGFTYILDIIVADTSSLKNRALAFAFSTSPSIITTFIGPVIARAFYEKSSWRWAFGASSIFFFSLSLPIVIILMVNTRKATRLGLLRSDAGRRAEARKSFRHYVEEYDAPGMVLLTLGLSMVLVPFSLGMTWASHRSMVLVVVGFVLLFLFAAYEHCYAKRPIIPFSLLFSRNVAGSCLVSIILFVSYFSWDSYYSSYLQVVHGLSISEAGYIDHIYGLGSCLWAVPVGYLIRASDRYKWLACIALPVHIIGGVCMIFFRRPDTHVSFLVLCQVLITVGGSTMVIVLQMAVMAVSSHGELASAMAILSLASYIGSAGGNALSGAIWNSTLPTALKELLPDISAEELFLLCSDLKKQLSYPMGHPIRDAVILAYDQAQVKMCIAGTAIALLQVVGVVLWQDVRVSQSKQVAGKVL